MAAWEVSPRRGTALSWRSHLFPSKLVGGAAALLTTLCWLPQALKLLRTRETRDLSLLAYVVFSAGILLWLHYGLLIGSVPVVAANAVTLVLALAIVSLKLRFG